MAKGDQSDHWAYSGITYISLADAPNEHRLWRMYADLAAHLIDKARHLYTGDSFGVELDQTVRPTGAASRRDYPAKLCRIKFHDAPNRRAFVFLTNHF